MHSARRHLPPSAICAITVVLAITTSVVADDIVWDANGAIGGAAWLTTTNWNPDTVPGSSDTAVFQDTSGSATIEITVSNPTNNGTHNQIVGAISLTAGESKTIRNGSTGTDGTLTLAGVNGVLLSNSSTNLTLALQDGSSKFLNLDLAASGTINVTSTTATISIANSLGQTGGSYGFTKTGAGTLLLSGTNTYTGNTIVNGGSLVLSTAGNNNIASSARIVISSSATLNVSNVAGTGGFKVGANQTLAGSGNIEGAVTADVSTATVMPGDTDSPGNLTLRSNFTLSSGKLAIESDSSSFSVLTVSGAVTLGGTLQLKAAHQPALNTPITILNKTGVGAISGIFSGLADNAYFHPDSGITGDWYKITYFGGTGNDIVISRQAIPEPGSLALLAVATSCLLRRRRREAVRG
jgi:autotransporter-associated beta strand protein